MCCFPFLLPNQGCSVSLQLCCTPAISAMQFFFGLGFICPFPTSSILEIPSRVDLLHFCLQPLMHFDTLYWSLENQNNIACGMSWGAGEIPHVAAACMQQNTEERLWRATRRRQSLSADGSQPEHPKHPTSPGSPSTKQPHPLLGSSSRSLLAL